MQVNDAHDRFANIEVDYLLQRMERFDGVAVLATNRKGDLDTAFIRRLRFIDRLRPADGRGARAAVAARARGQRRRDGRAARRRHRLGQARARARPDRRRDQVRRARGGVPRPLASSTPIGTRHVLAAARRELEKDGVVVRARPARRRRRDRADVRIDRLSLRVPGADARARRGGSARLVAERLAPPLALGARRGVARRCASSRRRGPASRPEALADADRRADRARRSRQPSALEAGR